MTERERDILRALIDLLAGDRPVVATEAVKLLKKAQELLDVTTDPEPDHPAVVAYRQWCSTLRNWEAVPLSEGFLAGWKQALEHNAGLLSRCYQDRIGELICRDLLVASNDTPTQLP